jgi:hypothetical protein
VRGQLDHPVGPGELGQHVGHDHDRLALLPPPLAVVPEVHVGAAVEALVRLVEQEHGRVGQEGQGQVQLLARATGEVARDAPLVQRVVELGEDLVAPAQRSGPVHPGAAAEHHQMVVGGQQLEQAGDLWAIPDAAADRDLPGVGPRQPRADLHEGRLARSVLPGERHHLPGVHDEIDAVEHGGAAVPLGDL